MLRGKWNSPQISPFAHQTPLPSPASDQPTDGGSARHLAITPCIDGNVLGKDIQRIVFFVFLVCQFAEDRIDRTRAGLHVVVEFRRFILGIAHVAGRNIAVQLVARRGC